MVLQAIHDYREIERSSWNQVNQEIIRRIHQLAFPPDCQPLENTHILDLSPNGFIKPHIDSIRFCGDVIAGLSLLSDCIMRFTHEKNKDMMADAKLSRRSLYIMR
ncbi:ALKBH7 [Cordylochernes scorpioides]|uniref:ALKBH7 n=1 Tax=Cordylochernes scorpioides TaxID=51811 RepID=A0ABY6KJ81_9ARAC|nr:ALKBH7 [Cordylochernes scorpioides]